MNYAELEEKKEKWLMAYVEPNQSRQEDVWFLNGVTIKMAVLGKDKH